MSSVMKRVKPELAGPKEPIKSTILKPFRTVGIVSNGVPSTVSTLGQSYIVSTVVGRSVQIYDAASLRLLFITQPQTSAAIECIYTHFHHLFVVSGSQLLVFRRGQLETEITIPSKQSRQRATKVIVFGKYVCVCVPRSEVRSSGSTEGNEAAVHVFKWTKPEISFYTSLTCPSVLGNIVDITHLPTYVNKLLVATSSCLVLFNVKTGKAIHTFGEIFEGITLIEAAPTALDKVAVVTGNGEVILKNIRTDRELFRLTTGESITSLSFRSDVGAESASTLGLGTTNGDVLFYSLDARRRIQSLRGFGGDSPVAGIAFIPGQAMALITTGSNRLVEMVFDPVVTSKATTQSQSQGAQQRARVLRQRGGHGQPSTCLLFVDEEAHFLLSSSLDTSLWAFSLRKDSQSHAFGGTQKVQLSPITAMAFSNEKSDRWDTLVTCHKQSTEARTWSLSRGTLGSLKLISCDETILKSVALSRCGNFTVLGSTGGSITVYNLQSGMLRMALPKAHKSAVTGVALFANNSTLISSSLDGTVRFYEFGSASVNIKSQPTLIKSLDLGQGALTDLKLHHGSGLLCITTDSMALIIIDTATMKVVRELWGHGNRITSFDFTPSGRWIISGSLDHTIRVWDVPTGACIDGVKLSNPVTCLRVSPNSEWIATSHVSGVGVQLWSLQTVGSTGLRIITEEEFKDIDMPSVSGENGVSLLEGLTGDFSQSTTGSDIESIEVVPLNPVHHKTGMITLSGQPANKFTTLVHLDAIRERNKPKEGLKKPEKLPFFLGMSQEESNLEQAESKNLINTEAKEPEGQFASKFTSFLHNGQFEELAAHLESLGPAATDLEIRSLDTRPPFSEVIAFIDSMTEQLKAGKRFELVQAWVGMLLKIHADVFAESGSDALVESFDRWRVVQKEKVDQMQESARFCTGVINYLKQM